jgi:hypothetical protein
MSLEVGTFPRSFLLSAGVILMLLGGFTGACIFIFKGPIREGVASAILLVVGSILFFLFFYGGIR